MKLLKSFRCAFRGVLYCISNERHMRVHTVFAVIALCLSHFLCLSSEKHAIIILTIAAVISAEIFNTALERLTDFFSPNYSQLAKNIKDISAGAVLVLSIAAIFIGIYLLWDTVMLTKLFLFFTASVSRLILLFLIVSAFVVYIVYGPIRIGKFFSKLGTHSRKQ